MNYSELSLAERDTGLSFDSENLSLIGEMNSFGVTISDRGDGMAFRATNIFCKSLPTRLLTLNRR